MVRPLRPPPQPLSSYVRRVYRRVFRLALRGPLWLPLAFGAAAFAVLTLLPLLGGGGVGLGQPWCTLAVLGAAGGVGLGVAAWPERYRLHRRRLHEGELASLRELPREDFAALVGTAYRRAGYEVVVTGRGQGAGIDLELHSRRGITLVQCRHYRDATVDLSVLRPLSEAVRAIRARGAIVVTTGVFTETAESYARAHRLTAVDGRLLTRMVRIALPRSAARRLVSG